MTTIEPLAAGDFEVASRWLSSPDINRWLTADWREKPVNATVVAIAVRNRRNRFYLVRSEGEPCGLVALSDLDGTDRTAMAWYILGNPQLSGRGIITEALRLLIEIAFGELALRCVYAWAMEPNTRSLGVLRKVGFREAGRIRESAQLDGIPTDRLYFDLIASDRSAPRGPPAQVAANS